MTGESNCSFIVGSEADIGWAPTCRWSLAIDDGDPTVSALLNVDHEVTNLKEAMVL